MTTLQVFYEVGTAFGSCSLVAVPAQWTAIVYCFKPKIVPNVAFGVWFLISGATDEHNAGDSLLGPGASAMVSVCVLSRVCDCCARLGETEL